MLLQVYALQYSWWIRRSARADWSEPAEGRRRQVRKTSSKDVLSLSLWSKSRGPKRQTKRPQSPSAPLSSPRRFSFRSPPQVPASLSYLFLHWFHRISLTLCHNTNLLNVEFCSSAVILTTFNLSRPSLCFSSYAGSGFEYRRCGADLKTEWNGKKKSFDFGVDMRCVFHQHTEF